MSRYSEIPGTPTPFMKSSSNKDLKVGSIVALPKLGKSVLRYAGPIEGKTGIFAGVELIGEGAAFGKNSGDVNGVHYFRTKLKGSGLFMGYDKFIASVESVESPLNKRLSIRKASPPSSKLHQETPSRHSSVMHNPTPALQSTVKKTRPVQSASVTRKASPSASLELELQKLKTANMTLSSERDDLSKQIQILNEDVQHYKLEYENSEKLYRELEKKFEDSQLTLDKSNKRVSLVEAKLLKQKKSYEEQRDELLEVIEQVELRVNQNEKLYITEMKSLQEQLNDKQKEVEKLRKLNSNSEDNSSTIVDQLKEEIKSLKSENELQLNSIQEHLKKIEESDSKFNEVTKENVDLRESHSKSIVTKSDEFEKTLKEKELKIYELNSLIKNLENDTKQNSSDSDIQKLNSKIEELEAKSGLADKQTIEITRLEKEVISLQKKLESIKPEDAVYELEYKLENKEKIIEDLKKELLSKNSDENLPSTSADQVNIKELTERLSTSEAKKSEYQKEIASLTEKLEKFESMEGPKELLHEKKLEIEFFEEKHRELTAELAEKDDKIKELEQTLELRSNIDKQLQDRDSQISKLEEDLNKLSSKGINSEELQSKIGDYEVEVEQSKEKIRQLQEQLTKIPQLEESFELIKTEKIKLEDILSLTQTELEALQLDISELKNSEDITKSLKEKTIEVDTLKKELFNLKTIIDGNSLHLTTNKELREQIQLLQTELDTRPTLSQINDLRSEMELIDELRKAESKTRDKEIYILQEKLSNHSTPNKTDSFINSRPASILTNTPGISQMSQFHRPTVISQVVDGELQVYIPEKKDPTSGRDLWCGLCERDGHDSIDCPYENEVF